MLKWLIVIVFLFVSGCITEKTKETLINTRETTTTVIIAPQEKMGNLIGDM